MQSVSSNAVATNCQGFITTSYTDLSFASGSTQLPYTIPANGFLVIGYNLWCNIGSRTVLEMGSNTMGGIPLKKDTNVVVFRPNTSTNSTVRFYPYS